MKKFLIGVGGVLVVLVAAAVVIPFLIPVEKYKSEIAERTRAATGRDLKIGGPLSFTIFPSISLTAEDVRFSNAPGGQAETMAALERLRLSVRFLPLLRGDLQVDGFELIDPEIHLEVDRNGRGNWVFAETELASEAEESGGSAAYSYLSGLSLENVALTGGRVTYYDARTRETTAIEDIDAQMSLPEFAGRFEAEGDFEWRKENISLRLMIAALKPFLDGAKEDFRAKVASDPISLSVDGTIRMADTPSVNGQVNLDIPSIRRLADWTGNPIEMPGTGLGPLKIDGTVDYTGDRTAFTNASLSLDNMEASGAVTLTTQAPRPRVQGRLDVETLDLNPYLPPTEEASLVWSEAPIDASGLSVADLDFSFTAQALKVREIVIGPSQLDLTVDNGVLTAELQRMQLYGGEGTGQLRLDGRQAAIGLSANFNLKGVTAEPLLTDAAEIDRLSGTFTTQFDVTASGRSQKDIVSALDGKGSFTFREGEIRGVDLAQVASTIERVVNGFSEGGAGFLSNLTSGNTMGTLKAVGAMFGGKGQVDASTKFTSLSGTFVANDGLFTNPDLELVGPLVNERAVLRMTGAGALDLADQTMKYEARIRSFPNVQQEGGGIGGTVRLTGAMTEPDACVVVGSLCIGRETKPGDIMKQKLLGDGGEGGTPQERLKSIGKELRGLFGGEDSKE